MMVGLVVLRTCGSGVYRSLEHLGVARTGQ